MSTTNVNKFQAAFRAKVDRVNEKKKIKTQRTIHGEDEAPEEEEALRGRRKMNAFSNEKMMSNLRKKARRRK